MTTVGDQLRQYGGAPVDGPLSPDGIVQFLKGGTGVDSHTGLTPEEAVKTLAKAQTRIVADKNGVIYLIAEDNSASGTTVRIAQTTAGAGLIFSKDGVKIQGVCQQGIIGHRARISNTADVADVTPLLSWSANNSSMADVHLFYGEADAGDLGAMDVSGERNSFFRCHIAGIGHATQDVANAYSLKVTGDENYFEDCVFGVDTILRDNSSGNNYVLRLTNGVRNVFKRCLFLAHPGHANSMFVEVTMGGGRWTLFDECIFMANPNIENYVKPTAVFNHKGTGHTILLKGCTTVGPTDWATGSGASQVRIDARTGAAATDGIALNSSAS